MARAHEDLAPGLEFIGLFYARTDRRRRRLNVRFLGFGFWLAFGLMVVVGVPGQGQVEPAEVSMPAGHRIEGTVLGRHGRELDGVLVALFVQDGLFEQGNRTIDWTVGASPVVEPLRRARTDRSGRYVFDGIETGVYRVEVMVRRSLFPPRQVLVSPIRLEAELRELGAPDSVVVEPIREDARRKIWIRPDSELGDRRAFVQRVQYGGATLLSGPPLELGRGSRVSPLAAGEAWVIWGEGLVPHREYGARFGRATHQEARYPVLPAVIREIRVVEPNGDPAGGVLLFFQGVAMARGDASGRVALLSWLAVRLDPDRLFLCESFYAA